VLGGAGEDFGSRAALAARETPSPPSNAVDPNAELKAEIAALEAQLMEKRRELSRRTGASQGLAPPGSA